MTSERIIYNDMVGHVFTDVRLYADNVFCEEPDYTENDKGKDRIIFVRDDGYQIVFYHVDDCCEYVEIEDVNGDYKNLIGKPLRVAEMYTTDVPGNQRQNLYDMYTFYRFATEDEFVTIRWHGSSNGYYSVEVDKFEIHADGQVTKDCVNEWGLRYLNPKAYAVNGKANQ